MTTFVSIALYLMAALMMWSHGFLYAKGDGGVDMINKRKAGIYFIAFFMIAAGLQVFG